MYVSRLIFFFVSRKGFKGIFVLNAKGIIGPDSDMLI